MSLLWRVIGGVGGLLLKAASLFLCLFLIHLLVTRAWPSLKQSAELAARRPAIEQQLRELEKRVAREDTAAQQLGAKLVAASVVQLRQLEEGVRSYEHELAELDQQRRTLLRRLEDARVDEEKYCTSWNPLKRYLCQEIKERSARTVQAVQPLLDEAERTAAELGESLEQARAALEQLRATEPMARASTPQAEALRLALYEKEERRAALQLELEQARAQLTAARAAESSPAAWLVREVRRVGWGLLAIVGGVLVLPYLQRTFAYFVFMPLVQRAPALSLVNASAQGSLEAGQSFRSLPLELAPNERCWSRAAYVRAVQGRTRSQWLFDWSAPFVSYAAGLSVVTRIEAGPDLAPSRTTLASPDDPDSYLLEVRLRQHPGFVVHPRNVVAVTGDLQLSTIWRLFSLHAWATGQLRFILVRGSGRCILEGRGDVTAAEVKGGRARIEQENVLGFDTRLGYATARSETFLPYLLGRTPLVTDVFCGEGLFLWQKNAGVRASSVVQRSFDAVFGAIGKLLGF